MSDAAFDQQCMLRALYLARRALYTTDPNPRVGCVLARDGAVIAEGFHPRAGEPHAERYALAAAGDAARGATAYVTLEPCSHTGRTGPCADALIQAGVARVVVAMQDPNPQVAGNGLRKLRDAGIEVEVGPQEQEARALNPGFIRRMSGQRPLVRIKAAASLDGRTAMASGESQWITGPQAREDVQRLRARSSAIVTGIGTVLADRPSYTVRPEQWTLGRYHDYGDGEVRPPLRVILDPALRTPPDSPVVSAAGPCLIAHGEAAPAEPRAALERAGAELLVLPLAARPEGAPEAPRPEERRGLDLTALLAELARRECNEVLVECGATLAGAFVRDGLFDELIVYMAPTLLGRDARALLDLPLNRMADQVRLRWADVRHLGDDLRLTLTPA
ncbi:bifunctional diaminohydroxyphosphoribosylaminopyrimidine deaminase/5-amino-6-(5-phosphoribosylamino)uracil reductase RibD [Alloalcanivorax profundimaris]|uniref:bifunctional diaminohydroxyphosphoribosylaminopyrimidine deaminase/5-amino-6-(5-phosphoribosylamino)uracil reductase RibD n=1 Tax=Alloalcanivorax profundimaris TaxID=2735259 RepID=UPI0018898741|nr:bifunctional diaminohydroxyphosphoribosylaminopyrimidine deaminase/5-amino-6-(5-phosphoribosylamino)uracil reductase RibD [Alloalcanivorax profundimaris]MBF1802368.1 bifunctional diaminohydroxyphosphoribosylaminopyrimidine deaminase/5-amino-6-(5-phosphoribosylamino)uracil reductase RibD [Alloalcanivorax profundimaris]